MVNPKHWFAFFKKFRAWRICLLIIACGALAGCDSRSDQLKGTQVIERPFVGERKYPIANELEAYGLSHADCLAKELPLTRCDCLTNSMKKTWRLVSSSASCPSRLPFDYISIHREGTWNDSNCVNGVWRAMLDQKLIIFASDSKTVRCQILHLSSDLIELQLKDWSPGLRIRLMAIPTDNH